MAGLTPFAFTFTTLYIHHYRIPVETPGGPSIGAPNGIRYTTHTKPVLYVPFGSLDSPKLKRIFTVGRGKKGKAVLVPGSGKKRRMKGWEGRSRKKLKWFFGESEGRGRGWKGWWRGRGWGGWTRVASEESREGVGLWAEDQGEAVEMSTVGKRRGKKGKEVRWENEEADSESETGLRFRRGPRVGKGLSQGLRGVRVGDGARVGERSGLGLGGLDLLGEISAGTGRGLRWLKWRRPGK